MASSLMTGSMPGMAASTSETWLFGGPPKAVEAPENSLALEATCACTSRPITVSQSPVAPRMRLGLAVAVLLMRRGPSLVEGATAQAWPSLVALRVPVHKPHRGVEK